VNEQTAFNVPGNSHTSRQASAELQYAFLTGDQSFVKKAILQLNWATYMVDFDGKNRYPQDDIWLSDGYGDYVRHYLRAMAFLPELAADDQNHILSSTSVIQMVKSNAQVEQEARADQAKNTLIDYQTYDNQSTEMIRMTLKPGGVLVNKNKIQETEMNDAEGWSWKPLEKGGILTIQHKTGNQVKVWAN